MKKQTVIIDMNRAKKNWEDVEVHKIAFGHLPDEACRSEHPLECNRADQPVTCDYHIADKCDGTLRGRRGTKHKVYASPSSNEEIIRYACIECEMCFDDE